MPLLMRRRSAEDDLAAKAASGLDGWRELAGETGAAGLPIEGDTARRGRNWPAALAADLFPVCANPACASGWLRLWRSRSVPVFEGGWSCSPECTRARIEAALLRELGSGSGAVESHRHRVPLGLAMLEQGWITNASLRRALEAQRAAGAGRLGDWLVRQHAASEQQVTRALALQWSCPVLGLDLYDAELMATVLPRLFVDALGALPLRIAAGRILYLGFEDRLDLVLAAALERMTGLRVEAGVVAGSEFHWARERALGAAYAPVELVEAASELALARALTRAVEAARPVEARLVRVHDFLWLRMWTRRQTAAFARRDQVRDLVCALSLRQDRGRQTE